MGLDFLLISHYDETIKEKTMEPVYKNVEKIPAIVGLNGGWSNHHYTDKMLIGERVTEETATHFIRNTTEVFSVEDEMAAIETQRWSPEILALHEISIIAENTIPPDGPEAAYGALDEILKIILPFRKYK
jgi:hypothetical protein